LNRKDGKSGKRRWLHEEGVLFPSFAIFLFKNSGQKSGKRSGAWSQAGFCDPVQMV
jgi:hypothetical protein